MSNLIKQYYVFRNPSGVLVQDFQGTSYQQPKAVDDKELMAIILAMIPGDLDRYEQKTTFQCKEYECLQITVSLIPEDVYDRFNCDYDDTSW